MEVHNSYKAIVQAKVFFTLMCNVSTKSTDNKKQNKNIKDLFSIMKIIKILIKNYGSS